MDETTLADVSRQLTLRLLSGDGESLDSVDTSSAEYQTQYQTVHDALAKNGSSYQVLATKVNNAVKLSIEKYVSEYNKDHAKAKTLEDGTVIKKGRVSVSSSKSFQRDYPYGAFAASVLGFCNGDGEGFYGLEKSYDDTLAGVNGRTITLRNAYGNAIADANATTYAAKDGSNLVLSLDVNVQEVVERYLNEAIYANTVENRGAAIVMNVKTGAILAMASKPDFDPNAPLDFSENLAYLNEQVNAEPEIYTIYKKDANGSYLRDEQGKKIPEENPDYTGTYRDIQWKNKTITELYYPGSVFKVITAAMGVDSGKATYYTTFNCSGAYGVAKETYHCAGKKSHGVQNLAEALRNSCNIYFIQLGQRLGPSVFYDYFDAFGFTERTGVDLPNETGMMKYYTKSQLGEVELSSSSFGQAMAVTPLQVCTAISAAVNGGYLVTPHVVDKITDQNGNVVEEIGANVRRQVISKSASETIRQIMEYEVGDGTTTGGGSNAYVAGYRIGGKSGTADKTGTKDVVVSFMCFAPADDPQYIMLLTMDTPSRTTGTAVFGGTMVAPVASQIMSEILPLLGVEPDYTAEELVGADTTVPNVVGQTREAAEDRLADLGFTFRTVGDGDTVTDQTPAGGAIVPGNASIILYLGQEKPDTPCTVPNVVGKSASEANKAITNAGLIMKVTGTTTASSGNVYAITQSLPAGTEVAAGTVVTVQFGDNSVLD